MKKHLTTQYLFDIINPAVSKICEHAGIGRQARLRGVCQPTCGFKSHCSHQPHQPRFCVAFCICGCGGTGRRARLRIWCLRRGGSSPFSRTSVTLDPIRFGFSVILLSLRLDRKQHFLLRLDKNLPGSVEKIFLLPFSIIFETVLTNCLFLEVKPFETT